MNSVPLYTLLRSGFPEVQISGEIWITDGNGTLFQSSEVNSRYPARSLLKPLQFLATELFKNGVNAEWHTAALGSISGTDEQVSQLIKWTAGPETLQLVNRLKATGMGFSHSCFSKHLSILQASQKEGWSLDDYFSQKHPFHLRLNKTLAWVLEEPENLFEYVVDGCRLPTPVLHMDQIARVFQKLAHGFNHNGLLEMRNRMLKNPDWIGGPERIDSCLMKDNSQLLIAKEGADGLLGLGILPNKKFERGLGIVIKIASGYQPKAAALALKPLLESLGLKCNVSVPEGQGIRYHYEPWEKSKKNWIDISPMLSEKTAVWPGDEKFSRTVSLNVENNDHLTLSAIKTTLHIGAHTDSPSHFGKSEKSISEVELWKYQGQCQVVEVIKKAESQITREDISGVKILAPRLLFKTNSFQDPNHFNKDFCAFSPTLIEYLAERGCILVGIDTPSVDLYESKELLTHKTIQKCQMAILEGIDLGKVKPGIFELVAFPLKIEGGDASPVRALLLREGFPSES